jgi:hypothetical protein
MDHILGIRWSFLAAGLALLTRDRSLNNVGVAPDVVIPPSDTADALAFARRYLRTHPRDASQGAFTRVCGQLILLAQPLN